MTKAELLEVVFAIECQIQWYETTCVINPKSYECSMSPGKVALLQSALTQLTKRGKRATDTAHTETEALSLVAE